MLQPPRVTTADMMVAVTFGESVTRTKVRIPTTILYSILFSLQHHGYPSQTPSPLLLFISHSTPHPLVEQRLCHGALTSSLTVPRGAC